MPSLAERLLVPDKRPRLIEECVRLIDEEVQHKSGLTGIAVKGAYAVVKAVKPGIIREAVDRLIDEFVERLEPFYAELVAESGDGGAAKNGALPRFLTARGARVADALLGVTDQRLRKVKAGGVKKAYEKLRPTAEKHVEAAVPGIGRVVERCL